MQARTLRRPSAVVKPTYVDMLRVWLRNPLPRTQFEWLGRHCGGGAKLFFPPRRTRFRCILQLHQPSDEALAYLARLAGTRLTYVETAIDLIFSTEDQCEDMCGFLDRHFVKDHLRREIHYCKTTRYCGARTSPNTVAIYSDRESKVTGELHCVHVEWRLRGHSLQRAGLTSVRDILNLDHRQFWQSRLKLYRIDSHKLGRMIWSRFYGVRRRTWVRTYLDGRIHLDIFRRTGYAKTRQYRTVQNLIHVYRDKIRIRDCLVRLDASHLLPSIRLVTRIPASHPES